MSTLISLVGLQPGAVASTAATLLKNANLTRVVLLPTRATEGGAKRLITFLQRLNTKLDIVIQKVETDAKASTSRALFAWDFIKNNITQGGLPEPIYYDVSPGLNYQVALISYHLKEEPGLIPVYADHKSLHCLGDDSSLGWPMDLEHIGFKALLDLHQLKSDRYPIKKEIIYDVKVTGGRERLSLVATCERFGRLHALVEVIKNATEKQPRQKARMVQALIQSPTFLKNLQPTLTILTNSEPIKNRVEAYKIPCLYCPQLNQENKLEEIKKWGSGFNHPPGSVSPGSTESSRDPNPIENVHANWQNNNLILTIGDDPGSTMLALFTHQPREAIILYDDQSDWIKAMTNRIEKQSKNIPAKRISFWPTDLYGNITSEFNKEQGGKEWDINITPGTKAQTWSLTRLPQVNIWSLYNSEKQSRPLLTIPHQKPHLYRCPPILLQASVIGGRLKNGGILKEKIERKRDFLRIMAGTIAQTVNNDGGKLTSPLPWEEGKIFPPVGSNTGYIKCLEIDKKKVQIKFEASLNRETRIDWISSHPNSGCWLEEPVGWAFLNAGGSNISDIRVGMRWRWLGKKYNEFRTEIDIALAWGSDYICISCKQNLDRRKLEDDRNEILAEARSNFGRFTLPVLVGGSVPRKSTGDIVDPLEISLGLLDKPGELEKQIKNALDAKRISG